MKKSCRLPSLRGPLTGEGLRVPLLCQPHLQGPYSSPRGSMELEGLLPSARDLPLPEGLAPGQPRRARLPCGGLRTRLEEVLVGLAAEALVHGPAEVLLRCPRTASTAEAARPLHEDP